ncbi:alpha/beta fold hydrolase [Sediminibacillus albus]|uniref:Proline iminopeptidase n=1 Tax=Sediminibacillus albus TaxID=407036 RepID=A0A1G8VH51_9BACI|nr:alpha/beta hydrolase [Sediminibacillus albus]SDJ65446.1 proline iminopeptidase [Sediminibacillus albus]
MQKWKRHIVDTDRGMFELFVKGEGEPVCVTHLYSEYNETGDYFAESFRKHDQVYLVNLREAGNSAKAERHYQLSMLETILDLEAIRTALGFNTWSFAGHSTGGMLGVVYGIYFSSSLTHLIIVGAAARDYTLSPDCIYNPDHPRFDRMQELIETLKNGSLPEENRKKMTIERTKLSLRNPQDYEKLFDKGIEKKISTARLNFFSRELNIFDVTKKLNLCKVNTLIVCGKYDVQCPWEYSAEMKQYILQSKLSTYNNSNHYPFLEEKQKFVKDIQAFMCPD